MATSNPAKHPEPTPGELWDFAVAVHGQAGVESACLALQDGFGLDVSLLLFAAWTGEARGLALTGEQAAAAGEWTRAWRAEVVHPLRAVRRHLGCGAAPIPGAATEALRAAVEDVELDSERIELAWLQAKAAGWSAPETADPVEHNLEAVFVQATGCAPDDHAARHLATLSAAVRRRTQERA